MSWLTASSPFLYGLIVTMCLLTESARACQALSTVARQLGIDTLDELDSLIGVDLGGRSEEDGLGDDSLSLSHEDGPQMIAAMATETVLVVEVQSQLQASSVANAWETGGQAESVLKIQRTPAHDLLTCYNAEERCQDSETARQSSRKDPSDCHILQCEPYEPVSGLAIADSFHLRGGASGSSIPFLKTSGDDDFLYIDLEASSVYTESGKRGVVVDYLEDSLCFGFAVFVQKPQPGVQSGASVRTQSSMRTQLTGTGAAISTPAASGGSGGAATATRGRILGVPLLSAGHSSTPADRQAGTADGARLKRSFAGPTGRSLWPRRMGTGGVATTGGVLAAAQYDASSDHDDTGFRRRLQVAELSKSKESPGEKEAPGSYGDGAAGGAGGRSSDGGSRGGAGEEEEGTEAVEDDEEEDILEEDDDDEVEGGGGNTVEPTSPEEDGGEDTVGTDATVPAPAPVDTVATDHPDDPPPPSPPVEEEDPGAGPGATAGGGEPAGTTETGGGGGDEAVSTRSGGGAGDDTGDDAGGDSGSGGDDTGGEGAGDAAPEEEDGGERSLEEEAGPETVATAGSAEGGSGTSAIALLSLAAVGTGLMMAAAVVAGLMYRRVASRTGNSPRSHLLRSPESDPASDATVSLPLS